MEKKKKIWAEPKLTTLVRRKPEEGILSACKMEGIAGPIDDRSGCYGTACELQCNVNNGT